MNQFLLFISVSLSTENSKGSINFLSYPPRSTNFSSFFSTDPHAFLLREVIKYIYCIKYISIWKVYFRTTLFIPALWVSEEGHGIGGRRWASPSCLLKDMRWQSICPEFSDNPLLPQLPWPHPHSHWIVGREYVSDYSITVLKTTGF